MVPQWPSPMFWMCVLSILLSASLAQGQPIPGPPLCVEATPPGTENGGLSFRFTSELGTDFRGASSGCGSGVDGILRGVGPRAQAASTAIQATRLMFGIDLRAENLLQFARRLGIAPQAPDRLEIGPFEAQRDDASRIRSHFLFRASRKSIFLGFGIQW
jgi:hypothetical protein